MGPWGGGASASGLGLGLPPLWLKQLYEKSNVLNVLDVFGIVLSRRRSDTCFSPSLGLGVRVKEMDVMYHFPSSLGFEIVRR